MKERNYIHRSAARGTYKAKYDRNSGINYITLMDSKQVSVLSTAAGINALKPVKRYSGETRSKVDITMPGAFSFYNKYMGSVDIHDQYCSKVTFVEK